MGMFDHIIDKKNLEMENNAMDDSLLFCIADMGRGFVNGNKQDLLNLFSTVAIPNIGDRESSCIVAVVRNGRKMQVGSMNNGAIISLSSIHKCNYLSLDVVRSIYGKERWAFLVYEKNQIVRTIDFNPLDSMRIFKLKEALEELVYMAYEPYFKIENK